MGDPGVSSPPFAPTTMPQPLTSRLGPGGRRKLARLMEDPPLCCKRSPTIRLPPGLRTEDPVREFFGPNPAGRVAKRASAVSRRRFPQKRVVPWCKILNAAYLHAGGHLLSPACLRCSSGPRILAHHQYLPDLLT
jgi:hypothetical protein